MCLPNGGIVASYDNRCQWIALDQALSAFASSGQPTQSQRHIKPLHWYVACRLVIEGGFAPDEIVPRPPFSIRSPRRGRTLRLEYDPTRGGTGESTILGGLKAKDIDVVVSKPGIGPCLAVSVKGTLNAFRNLTNRMEEAVGDCTNLHIAYPNLVYGFLHVLRANREGEAVTSDVSVGADGNPVDAVVRYENVLSNLSGRRGVRDDVTRYESLALALVEPAEPPNSAGLLDWPSEPSPLRLESFFDRLYREYDLRYVYAAPKLEKTTRRLFWAEDSPALNHPISEEFEARLAP